MSTSVWLDPKKTVPKANADVIMCLSDGTVLTGLFVARKEAFLSRDGGFVYDPVGWVYSPRESKQSEFNGPSIPELVFSGKMQVCSICYAVIKREDSGMHEDWHDFLKRSINEGDPL